MATVSHLLAAKDSCRVFSVSPDTTVFEATCFMNAEHIYQRWTLESPCELVTLQGNFARLKDGSGFTHLHATFTNDDVEVHAGHLFEATVEVVAEIHMRVMSQSIMTRCPMADSEFVALSFE